MSSEAMPVISEKLIHTTVRSAATYCADPTRAREALSTKIYSLVEGELQAMIYSQWKFASYLIAGLAISLLGGVLASGIFPAIIRTASAGTIVYDDFNDGDIADASPISWRPVTEHGTANGSFDASSGDLTLAPQSENDTLAIVVDPKAELSDVSMRVQLRNDGANNADTQVTGVILRVDLNSLAFIEAGIDVDGLLYIQEVAPTVNILGEQQSDFRPLDEDVVLQVDAIGPNVKLFAWRPGEAMPQQPQIEAVTNWLESGTVGLFQNPPPGNGAATFRYVWVADVPIPEPASASLVMLGGGLLAAAGRWRYRR
jgi:hypothetical protein